MIFNNFNGGLSGSNQVGVKGSYKEGYNLLTRRKEDTLKCDHQWDNISQLNGKVVSKFITVHEGTFAFCLNGKVYRSLGGNDGYWTEVWDALNPICGAGVFNDGDNISFYIITGYTNDDKAKQIYKAAPDTNQLMPAWVDNFTQNTGTLFNPMVQVFDRLLFSEGNAIGMIDTNGIQYGVEEFPNNQVVNCMACYNNYLLCGMEVEYGSESRIKIVDCSDEVDVVKETVVPFSTVENIITSPEQILVIGNKKLYSYDLTSLTPIHEIDGVCDGEAGGIKNGLATFMTCSTDKGNYVYQYGRNTYFDNNSLTKSKLPLPEGQQPYACGRIYDGSGIACLYGSFSGTNNYYTYKENKNKYETGYWESLDIYPSVELSQTTTVGTIKLTMAPLPAGCKVRVGIRKNKTTTGGTSNDGIYWLNPTSGSSGNNTYFDEANKTEATFHVNANYDIVSICVQLIPNNTGVQGLTPEIYLITIK